MNIFIKILYAFSIGSICIGCNHTPKNTNKTDRFDTKQMISNITNDVILPSIKEFKNNTILLDQYILDFAKDLTEENLILAKEQWKKTATSYATIYAFNIGKPKKQFMHHLLYNWPVFVKDITKTMATDTEIDIDKMSTRSKGLAGLEYLVFVSHDISNKEIIALFESNPKRVSFLVAVANDLKKQGLRLSEIWNGKVENYTNTLINNSETGLKGSLNMICNGIFNVAETVKKAKLGKPAGLQGTAHTNFDLLQAYRSQTSLTLIKNNIKSIERTYFNASGLGISDKVKSISKNNDINDEIKKQFDAIYLAIDQITMPLYLAINQQKEQVKLLFDEITKLVWLFNNDVRSTLSIIITPTDNDGD